MKRIDLHELPRDEKGNLHTYVWPGGYEGAPLYCDSMASDNCMKSIESAYGDPDTMPDS